MKVLLDTQTWLWWIQSPERLNREAHGLFSDRRNVLFFSAASSWEIAIKYALGKLKLPTTPGDFVPSRLMRDGLTSMPVEHVHALQVATLPTHHRDPFDRILIAQAQVERLPILTADPAFAPYAVKVVRSD